MNTFKRNQLRRAKELKKDITDFNHKVWKKTVKKYKRTPTIKEFHKELYLSSKNEQIIYPEVDEFNLRKIWASKKRINKMNYASEELFVYGEIYAYSSDMFFYEMGSGIKNWGHKKPRYAELTLRLTDGSLYPVRVDYDVYRLLTKDRGSDDFHYALAGTSLYNDLHYRAYHYLDVNEFTLFPVDKNGRAIT